MHSHSTAARGRSGSWRSSSPISRSSHREFCARRSPLHCHRGARRRRRLCTRTQPPLVAALAPGVRPHRSRDRLTVNFAREGLLFIVIAVLVAGGGYALALNRRSWPLWLLAFVLTILEIVSP